MLGTGKSIATATVRQPFAGKQTTYSAVESNQWRCLSEILDMMGLAGLYACEPPPLDESSLQKELMQQDLHPTIYTRKLAEAKAHSLATKHATQEQDIVIPVFYLGSDTVVEIDDKILEKPNDEQAAKQMLRKLSGQEVSELLLLLL